MRATKKYYDNESFLTKDSAELALYCLNQVQYHRKEAAYHQSENEEAGLNGLDQIQMMVDDGDRWITYWRAGSYDAAGRLVSEVNGNGLHTEKTYNPAGEIDQILSRFGYEDPIRHLSWQYDKNHNMTDRRDLIQGVGEEFGYDELDRLKEIGGGEKARKAATGKSGKSGAFSIRLDSREIPAVKNGKWERSGGRRAAHSGNPVIPIVVTEKAALSGQGLRENQPAERLHGSQVFHLRGRQADSHPRKDRSRHGRRGANRPKPGRDGENPLPAL